VAAELDHIFEGFKHIDILARTISGVTRDFGPGRQHKSEASEQVGKMPKLTPNAHAE